MSAGSRDLETLLARIARLLAEITQSDRKNIADLQRQLAEAVQRKRALEEGTYVSASRKTQH